MKNYDVRAMAKNNGVCLWQIAEELGIADTTLCRRMRRELPTEEKERIFSIIRKLSGEVN